MFVYCRQCKFETNDADSREELKVLVEAKGGRYNVNDEKCPQCGSDRLYED
jgi:uncharacterized protein (DUF983 family)